MPDPVPDLTTDNADAAAGCPAPTRYGAGQDPAKRDQILAGAGRVIGRMGYDAASVMDIAREAGVSKGTIYVYFQGKEDLFEALMEETRNRLFRALESELERPGTTRERLVRYATVLAGTLCSDSVVRAHRVVVSVTERMPELGQRFYERGASRGTALIAGFLEGEITAGRMAIPDLALAAAQFVELAMAGLFRKRLFAHMTEPPQEADLIRIASSGVDMFLKNYGTPEPAAAMAQSHRASDPGL